MVVRRAARSLRRSKTFTIATVATLALSTSLAATVFAVVDGVLFKPLPYPQAHRLFLAMGTADGARTGAASLAAPDITYLSTADPRVLVAGFGATTFMRHPASPERQFRAVRVGPGFFEVLGQAPLAGGFSSEAFQQAPAEGAVESAILSHAIWRQWTGADPEILGRTLELVGRRLKIVGVLAPHFLFPGPQADIILPLVAPQAQRTDRWARTTTALVRMGEGISYEEGKSRLDGALAAHAEEYPVRNIRPGPYTEVFLRSVESALGSSERSLFSTAFVAACLLAVIGCINVAGLLAARGRERERELAVMTVLGASRWDVARQLLLETLMLSTAAALVALALAQPMLAGVMAIMPEAFNLLKAPAIDWRVAGFALLAATATQMLFALFPIGALLRADLIRPLSTGVTHTPRARSWARGLLVSTEAGIGVTLVISGSILFAGHLALRGEDSGFGAVDRLTVIQVLTPGAPGQTGLERRAGAVARIAAMPQVEGVATVGAPMMDNSQAGSRFRMPVGASRMMVSDIPVSPTFYEVSGLSLVEGRFPTREERMSRAPVAVVSRPTARGYWPGRSAVGQTLEGSRSQATVIGVVEDVRLSALDEINAGEIFLAADPAGAPNEVILVRTRPGAALQASDIALAISRDVPGVIVRRAQSMRHAIARSISDHSFRTFVFVAAACAALLLVAVGVGGLAATGVVRRERELGIRTALGAQPSRIVTMIVGDYLRDVAAGISAGLMLSWWSMQVLQTFAYEVDVYDPVIWVAAVAVLLGACTFAAWVPARRAARVDPLLVLRSN